MVSAWFMNDSPDDQRNEHHLEPPQFVDLEYLKQHGVLHWKLDADNYESDSMLDKIRKDRGYNYHDIVDISETKLPNYHQKLKMFFEEHIHTDEEIRFVVDGSGYFDIRDKSDKWVRIYLEKGDLIILPAGIYHRFTLDSKNYIKAMRLFCGDPVWTPHNRGDGAVHPKHEEYVQRRERGELVQ